MQQLISTLLTRTMIGYKFIVLILIFICLIMQSCWIFNSDDEGKPYVAGYTVKIDNTTNDTVVILGLSLPNMQRSDVIYPGIQIFEGYPGVSLEDEIDPLDYYFQEWDVDTIWIYSYDSVINYSFEFIEDELIYPNQEVLVKWHSPLSELPIDSNNFFNVNSWQIWFENERDPFSGIMQFTITESDFE